jgi:hypothetical protein
MGCLVSRTIFSRKCGWTRTGAAGIRQHIECVVQGEVLSFGDDTPKNSGVKPGKKTGDKDQQMGSALRSVYQKTVDEAVPDEMLALLGKLD